MATFGLSGSIDSPSNTTYTLVYKATSAFTIVNMNIVLTSGTLTANLKINSTSVTSISAVAVTNSNALATATGANSVVAGDLITLVVTSANSAVGLLFTVKCSF